MFGILDPSHNIVNSKAHVQYSVSFLTNSFRFKQRLITVTVFFESIILLDYFKA